MNQIEQLMCRSTAQFCLADTLSGIRVSTHMLENNQRRNHFHFALAGGTVMFIHIQNTADAFFVDEVTHIEILVVINAALYLGNGNLLIAADYLRHPRGELISFYACCAVHFVLTFLQTAR